MKAFVTIGLGLLTVVVIAAAFAWNRVQSGLAEAVATSPLQPVFFLDDLPDGEVAVLLHPVVTGGETVIVRDPEALRAAQGRAFVTDKQSAGEAFGTIVLAMMGGRNMRPVLSVFVDGAFHMKIECNSAQCNANGWTDADFGHDLAGLLAHGEPAAAAGTVLWDYDAYLEAHARVLADPDRYFSLPGQETLSPPDDGRRSFRLLLPSHLHALQDGDTPPYDAPAEEIAALEDRLSAVLDGLDAAIDAVTISPQYVPIVTGPDGMPVPGFGDAQVSLDGYVLLTPNIVFTLPEDQTEAARDRILAQDWPRQDETEIAAIVAAEIAARGLEPCVPSCMVDPMLWKDEVEMNGFTPQSWDMRHWQVITE